jgi:hypothetical protein
MAGTLDGRTVENDAKRVGAQFERANYVTIDGASHDFWFLRPPPRVPELIAGFLRGEPVEDEQNLLAGLIPAARMNRYLRSTGDGSV